MRCSKVEPLRAVEKRKIGVTVSVVGVLMIVG
jgi:hypothetical protein